MPRVIYAPAADDDLLAIAEYIARDKPEAARRWVASIDLLADDTLLEEVLPS